MVVVVVLVGVARERTWERNVDKEEGVFMLGREIQMKLLDMARV